MGSLDQRGNGHQDFSRWQLLNVGDDAVDSAQGNTLPHVLRATNLV
jgi:hypothetical protein